VHQDNLNPTSVSVINSIPAAWGDPINPSDTNANGVADFLEAPGGDDAWPLVIDPISSASATAMDGSAPLGPLHLMFHWLTIQKSPLFKLLQRLAQIFWRAA